MADLESSAPRWPALIQRIRARTPARLLVSRAGASYRTQTQLELRQAHAAARDAVRTELDLEHDLGSEFIRRWKVFEVSSHARSKDEYLLRPDLGRKLSEDSARTVLARCAQNDDSDLQVIIGDGLSVTAVATQVPSLLPLLAELVEARGWRMGQTFAVRYCRVGLMNHVGEILRPRVVTLLIGERPGLATAESLSAYMAYAPRLGHTDAQRNLISNIHARGVPLKTAAERIANLAAQMMLARNSGSNVKEQLTGPDSGPSLPGDQ